MDALGTWRGFTGILALTIAAAAPLACGGSSDTGGGSDGTGGAGGAGGGAGAGGIGKNDGGVDALSSVCTQTGGAIVTKSCCLQTTDFPSTCGVGGCSCPPGNSHDIHSCNCPTPDAGTALCFDPAAGCMVPEPSP